MASANLIQATANHPQVLAAKHLVAATPGDVFRCAVNTTAVIATATVCNTSASLDRTVYLSVAKSGDTAGALNRVAVIDLGPNESCVVDELVGLMLGPDDAIAGYASASPAVAIVVTGAVSS